MLVDIHSHYWEYPQHFSDDFQDQAKRARGDVEVDLTVRWNEYHASAAYLRQDGGVRWQGEAFGTLGA